MPTVILLDDTVHTAHPDEDSKTFCGEDWSYDSAERVVSMATSAEHVVNSVARDEEAERCEECLEAGREWATPEDEL